jgi:uncharacterized protein involved in tolerance to divalent cations
MTDTPDKDLFRDQFRNQWNEIDYDLLKEKYKLSNSVSELFYDLLNLVDFSTDVGKSKPEGPGLQCALTGTSDYSFLVPLEPTNEESAIVEDQKKMLFLKTFTGFHCFLTALQPDPPHSADKDRWQKSIELFLVSWLENGFTLLGGWDQTRPQGVLDSPENYGLPANQTITYYYLTLPEEYSSPLVQDNRSKEDAVSSDDLSEKREQALHILSVLSSVEKGNKASPYAQEEALVLGGLQASKAKGSVDSLIEAFRTPTVDWRKELSSYLGSLITSTRGMSKPSWSRPSRKQAGIGYGPGLAIMPGTASHTYKVVYAVDTSGSMDGAKVTRALSEVTDLLRGHTKCEVEIWLFHTEIYWTGKVQQPKDLLKQARSGGTDINKVLNKALSLSPYQKPDLLIIATDLENRIKTAELTFPTLWLGIDPRRDTAPFGKLIRVEA